MKEKLRNEVGKEDQIKKIDEDIQKLEDLYKEIKNNKAPEFEEYTAMK